MLLLFLILGFAVADEANKSYNSRNRRSIEASKRRHAISRKRNNAWKRYDDGYGHSDGWFL